MRSMCERPFLCMHSAEGHRRAGWNFLKGSVSGCKHCRANETAPGWELPHEPSFHSFLLLFYMATFLGSSCLDSWVSSATPLFGTDGQFILDKIAVPSERQVTLELYSSRIASEGFWKEEIASMYIFSDYRGNVQSICICILHRYKTWKCKWKPRGK